MYGTEQVVYVGDNNSTICRTDLANWKRNCSNVSEPLHVQILDLEVVQDTKTMYSVGNSGKICSQQIKSAITVAPKCETAHPFNSTIVHYVEHEDALLTTGGDHVIRVWNASNLLMISTFFPKL